MQNTNECGEVLQDLTRRDVLDRIRVAPLPDPSERPRLYSQIKHGIRIQKVCAACSDFEQRCGAETYGYDTIMSGILLLPLNDTSREVVEGTHLTVIISHATQASNLGLSNQPWDELGSEVSVSLLLTASGNRVGILPDYMGYGESQMENGQPDSGSFRAYLIREAYLKATLPLFYESQKLVSNISDCRAKVSNNVITMGYSEGAFAAVSLANDLDKLGFNIISVLAGGGPYKVSSAQLTSVFQKVKSGTFNLENRFILALLGSAFSDTYESLPNFGQNQSLLDPQARNDLVNAVNNNPDADKINSFVSVDDPSSIFNPLLQASLAVTQGEERPCSTNAVKGESDLLCQALVQQDLDGVLESTSYPVDLCHSLHDDLVAIENLPDFMKNPLLIRTEVPGTHQEAGEACYAAWTDQILNSEFDFPDQTVPFCGFSRPPSSTSLPTEAPIIAGAPIFLPDHPYVPQDWTRRSLCPGLNVLANHGYINRNGKDVTLDDIALAGEEVFGIRAEDLRTVGLQSVRVGLPVFLVDGKLAFDLFESRQLDFDGSLFHDDAYFSGIYENRVNFSLINNFLDSDDDGMITLDDLASFRTERVLESRRKNPTHHFGDTRIEMERIQTDLLLFAGFTNRSNFVEVFLKEGRIPDDFKTRQQRGLPLISSEDPLIRQQLETAVTLLSDAVSVPLTFKKGISTGENVAIGISSLLAFAGILWGCRFLYRVREERKSQVIPPPEGHQGETSHIDMPRTESAGGLARRSVVVQKNLSWDNLSLRLDKEGKRVLSNVSGEAIAGELTCIMGPSGSGKTTLLHVLGGRNRFDGVKTVEIDGSVLVNGKPVDVDALGMNQDHRMAFLAQEDHSLIGVTAREAIRFSARLRLPRKVTETQILDLVEDILDDLGLLKLADRPLFSLTSLSGGERRRVALGIELVTRPSILLLDEVTSGLDTHSAVNVVQVCRSLAQYRKASVLMTIHQPNSVIFAAIDRLVLLKEGACIYSGDSKHVAGYFEERGFATPEGYSFPDWAMEVSHAHSIQELKGKGFLHSNNDTSMLAKPRRPCLVQCASSTKKLKDSSRNLEKNELGASFRTEVRELFRRHFLSLRHNHWPTTLRYIGIFFIALFFGCCLFGVLAGEPDPAELSSRVGVVFVLGFNVFLVIILKVGEAIEARRVFTREYLTGHYRLSSYVLYMIVWDMIDLCMLNVSYLIPVYWTIGIRGRFAYWFAITYLFGFVVSASGSLVAVLLSGQHDPHPLIPIFTTPQLILSGFLVSYSNLPPATRWLVWLQPLTYTFRLLLHEELSSCSEFSKEDQHILDCLEAMDNGFKRFQDEGLEAIYGPESVLTLMAAGQYVGEEAILEYLAYFSPGQDDLSLLWDFRGMSGTQMFELNDASPGFCDLTLSDITQFRVNEMMAKEKGTWFEIVFGRRVRISFPRDKSSFSVVTEDLFFPPSAGNIIEDELKASATSSAACTVLASTCPYEFAVNNFANALDCTERMDGLLPGSTVSDVGLTTVDGNSTGCRHLHAALAAVRPETHCPHLSLIPMEDLDGKVKCNESANYDLRDFFSTEDFTLFRRTAEKGGLPSDSLETGFLRRINATNRGTPLSELVERSAVDHVFPSTFACHYYLTELQDTSPDKLLPYGMALVIFWLAFRLLSIWLLKSRALGRKAFI